MIHWSLIWHKVPVCQIGLPLSFVSLNIKREIVTFARIIRPGILTRVQVHSDFCKKQQKKCQKMPIGSQQKIKMKIIRRF